MPVYPALFSLYLSEVSREYAAVVARIVSRAEFVDHLLSTGVQDILDAGIIDSVEFGRIAADHVSQELALSALNGGAVVGVSLDADGEADLGPRVGQSVSVATTSSSYPLKGRARAAAFLASSP